MLVPYSGGPIVRCPLITTSFWGPAWSDPSHMALAASINQFNQDFVASQAMNVISQYGITGGLFSGASYLSWVPSTLTVSDYQGIIQSCIDAGAFSEPGDPASDAAVPILLIYLDENTVINGGGRQLNFPGAPDVGFHDSFTTTAGHPLIYAFTGYFDLTTITVVSSHEFCEMITDPLYNAWTPDSGYHEIGDYCQGSNDTITVDGRTWTIQQEWSDVDNSCRGTAPTRLPAISPGPGGATLGGDKGVESRGRGPRVDASRQTAFERLLPLPPRHIDSNFHQTVHDHDLHAYQRRLFHPLHHSHLFSDFPKFLRQAADLIEARNTRTARPGSPPAKPGHTDRPGSVRAPGER